MKLLLSTIVIVLLCGRAATGQSSENPDRRFNVHISKGTLYQVRDTLAAFGKFSFTSEPNLDGYKNIHVSVDNGTVEEIMRQALMGLPLEATITHRQGFVWVLISNAEPEKLYKELPQDTVSTSVNDGLEQVKIAQSPGAYATEGRAGIELTTDRNLFTHLDGNLSGLTMGAPNNPRGFSIGGNNTFMGNGAPLIVLDKFAYYGSLDIMNYHDLRDAIVLKDAVAAGKWGAYSGNGVLVLDTREGTFKEPLTIHVIFNSTITGKPRLSYQRMSPAGYIQADSIWFNQHFFDGYINDAQFALPPSVKVLTQQQQGLITPLEAGYALSAMRNHNIADDLSRYLYRSRADQGYFINAEGGNYNNSYYASVGYDRDPTGLVRNNYERTTVHGNYQHGSDTDRFKITAIVNLAFINTVNNNTGDVPVSYPYASLADSKGRPLAVSYQYNPLFVDTASGSYPEDWHYRPLQELALADNCLKRENLYFQTSISYRLFRDLTIEAAGQWMNGHSNAYDDNSKDGFFVRSLVNSYSQPAANGAGYILPIPSSDILITLDTNFTEYHVRGQLSFKHAAHSGEIKLMTGAEVSDAETTGQAQLFYGHDSPTGNVPMDLVNVYPIRPTGGEQQIPTNDALLDMSNRAVSLFFNTTYSWRNRNNIYGALRYDASNILGMTAVHKWSPFWSVGYSRNLGLLPGQDTDRARRWAPRFNIRTSFGCNGNISNRSADLVTQYLGLNSYGIEQDGVAGAPDPTLSWETVYIFNIGADFEFFRDSVVPQGRVSGSINLYQRWAVGLLSYDTLPPSAGVPSFEGNSAGITGQGMDISLQTVNIVRPCIRFRWSTLFVAGINRDWVSRFPYQAQSPSAYVTGSFLEKGKPSTAIYSYRWAGLDPATGDPQGWLGGQASKNYTAIMNDSGAGKVFSGVWQPLVTFSLLNSIELGAFSFAARIDCRTGYSFRRSSIDYYALATGSYRGNSDYDRRWQHTGDKTDVPSQPDELLQDRDLYYASSQVLMTRADNIRWRMLNLSYTLKPKDSQKSKFSAVTFYLNLYNVAILWRANHYGIDPDAAGYGQLPPVRTYSMGVRLTI